MLWGAVLEARTVWCAGMRNGTASDGVEGFTADHLAAFKRHGTERVLIAYDRDDAGEAAAVQLAERLSSEGLRCYRMHFPRGLDANAYALEHPPAEQSLGLVLRHAVFLGQGPTTPSPGATKQEQAAAAPPLAAPPVTNATASPEPAPPPPDIPVTLDGDDVHLVLGDRRYRIRGLQKNTSPDLMKVNLLVRRGGNGRQTPRGRVPHQLGLGNQSL